MTVKLWISGARPKTLTTSLSSVVVGACCAYPVIVGDLNCAQTRSDTSQCAAVTADAQAMMSRFWLVTLLCVCVGVLLQIAVNYANDYSDGIRGVDEGRGGSEKKTKKPMRLTASGLVPAKHVLVAAVVSALLACVCGLVAVVLSQAWWLLLVGVLCLLAGWFYTGGKHPYGYVGLGEVGVFLFFGLAAVLGTEYALCGTVDVGGLLGAVAAGLFSCLIMMVNNIRDIDEDREHGKCTLAVRLGESGARTLLIVCCVAAWAIALLMCATLWWPWGAVLLISGVGIPVRMVSSVNKRQFRPALPAASFQTLLFAVVLAVSVTL